MTEKVPELKMPSLGEMRAADESIGIVHMISGKTQKGEEFYAYLSIQPSRYEDFMLISSAGEPMNLADFGKVLETGFGKEPALDVRGMIELKYALDPDFMLNLRKEAEMKGSLN